MIISTPEIRTKDGRVIVSARITYEHRPLNKPETAWFSYPEEYASFISGRADPFAVSLLPLAQVLGEDLTIEGSLSPRLVNGMREYQQVMAYWIPNQMRLVNIIANDLEPLPVQRAGKNLVTLFSGGVDSSHSLMSHLPEYQPDPAYQVRGALFIHGLDIPLQNQASYLESFQTFERYLTPLGIDLISCATNLHYFSSGLLKWGIAHAGVIFGAGLALDGWIANLVVPSSYSLDELIPRGINPMVDHLLSTETLKMIHHGATSSRVEKVAAISNWEPAQQFLRVCVDEKYRFAVNNCSKCEKCIRTMTMLEICGTLQAFTTFKQPFSIRDIYRWTPHYEFGEVWVLQTIHFARSQAKRQYIFPLQVAHIKGRIRNWIYRRIPRWLFKLLKAHKFPYQQDLFNPDFLPPGM